MGPLQESKYRQRSGIRCGKNVRRERRENKKVKKLQYPKRKQH